MFIDNYSVKTNLKKLFMQRYERYLPTAFDESMSLLEKMNKLIDAQNSLIDVVNAHAQFTSDQMERGFDIIDTNLSKQLKEYRDELTELTTSYEEIRDKIHSDLLPDSVKQKLEEWLLNGTIEELINDVIFGEIQEKLEIVENRLVEYDVRERHVYIDSENGSPSNTGELDSPFKSLNDAFNLLKLKSDKGAEGSWVLNVSGEFNEGYRIFELPFMREPLKIVGETDSNGDPLTVLNGLNSTRQQGLWFEPCEGLSVELKNIVFKNYSSYGVLLQDGGNLHIENCHAIGCNIGFSSINQGRMIVRHSYIDGCQIGVRSTYNGTLTVGGTTNTDYNKCVIKNCVTGVHASRNSVGHVDFSEISNCSYAGVNVDMASRVNCVSSTFTENEHGVRTEGSAEWIDNNNIFVDNVVMFQHFGVSGETRKYRQTSNVVHYMPPHIAKLDINGFTDSSQHEIITLPSTHNVDRGHFNGLGKKMVVKVYGEIVENPDARQLRFYLHSKYFSGGGYRQEHSNVPLRGVGKFVVEFETLNIDVNRQFNTAKAVVQPDIYENQTYYNQSENTITPVQDRALILSLIADRQNIKIKVSHVEVGFAG